MGALMAHAASIDPRFSIPWRRLRPYASVGVGMYTVFAYHADGHAIVTPDPALQLPASVGLEVLIRERVGLEAEESYRFLFDKAIPEDFARTSSGPGASASGCTSDARAGVADGGTGRAAPHCSRRSPPPRAPAAGARATRPAGRTARSTVALRW